MSETIHPDTFLSSIRPLVIFGQICGLLPLRGIFGSAVIFTWKNPVLAYGFLITVITMFFDVCYTMDNLNSKFGIDVFASTVFYSVCLLTTYLFFQIAREFHQISAEFDKVDTSMWAYGYPKQLGFKMKLFLYLFVVLAVVEHGTLVCINIASIWTHKPRNESETFESLLYTLRFSAIERRVPYSRLNFLTFFWTNIICTFNWNYLDFFIVSFSMEISARFALINSNLSTNFHLADESSSILKSVQKNYNDLSLLTKKIDRRLGKIILTSFFSNLYHLSLQLNRTLKLKGTLPQRIYFYFSLCYLMARLLSVLFFTSKVHEESKKPVAILSHVKKPTRELRRFLHQALTDDVALTGHRFFLITRKFMVSVMGTILTYQVCLLQFNSLNQKVEVELEQHRMKN